jgi:hypothetical protein
VTDEPKDTGVGPAPPETVALWVQLVGSMGLDELDSFERRTFLAWDAWSLGDVRRAIERRRREFKPEGGPLRAVLPSRCQAVQEVG